MSKKDCKSTVQKDEVAQLLDQIAAEGQGFLSGENGAREKLVASARALIFAAEEPMDTLLWHIWLEVCLF